MKKYLLMSLIIMSLIIFLVFNLTYEKKTTFAGENNNWEVEVYVDKKFDTAEGTLFAEYTGNNMKNLLNKEFRYQIDYKSASAGSAGFFPDNGVLEGPVFSGGCSIDCSYFHIDDSQLYFTIVIDGEEETITLSKSEQDSSSE